MKAHHSELISALVDGELKGLRRWLVQRHVNRCAMCAVEYRHIHHVREMLAANPVTPSMSDSPEFFWSKVKREIQTREGQTTTVPMPALSFSDWIDQHRYALTSVATMLVAAAGLVLALRTPHQKSVQTVIIQPPIVTVVHSSTLIADTVATTIDATDAEPAVIWVSGLPWSSNMTEMKEQFAQLDS